MALDTTIGGTATDSYITLQEWWDYWTARGVDLTQHGHDAAHEADLRRSAQILNQNYNYLGQRQYQFQAMAWPRLVRGLVRDWPIDPDTIPRDIKDAQAELAYLIHEGLDPLATIAAPVKAKREKVGPIERETEYAGSIGAPRIVAIEGILRPYVMSGSNQARMVRG